MARGAKGVSMVGGQAPGVKRSGGRDPLRLRIALTAKWLAYPHRLRWIAANGFALEYAPDPEALHTLGEQLAPYVSAGIPIRYHGFLPGYEIGHKDKELAERGVHAHIAALDAMCGLGEQVITFHIGLSSKIPIAVGRAVENLTRVVEHGWRLGITVCLENLRRGPTSDPRNLIEWAKVSGAMTTLDIGHAIESEIVKSGEMAILDFVEIMAPRLQEVHMYERETDRHHPPEDMRVLGPIVDRLMDTECDWWTIELDDYAEALDTRRLLLGYLQKE
jgi:hypothetical protein